MTAIYVSMLTLILAPAVPGAASDRLPSVARYAAEMEARPGFVPYYWDARKGRLLLEISRWNEEFLYGASLAGGAGLLEATLDRDQLGPLGLCRFERAGPRVLLRQLQMGQRAGATDREQRRVVEESFPSSVMASLSIVAEEGTRVLVDATEFLLGDARVLPTLRQAQLGEWRQDAARSAFHFERSGAFPKNTEIEAELTFTSDRPGDAIAALLPDGRSMTLRVHHTFVALPPPGFASRPIDPRVGFFGENYQDHAASYTEPIDRTLASRWRLVKKNPAAARSEPVAPIVFYLDPGMPEPERSVIRDAALWWNHAFEEAGFTGALVIRDLPAGTSLLDARYSGIAWVSRAERGWSVGQTQTDPRTGEILHAVVLMDSHRRRTTARMWQNLQPPRSARDGCDAADAPDIAELVARADDPRPAGSAAVPGPALGAAAVPEDSLVYARLAYLSAHEVGHTLGLAHNWAATAFRGDHWGSVMDYLGPNIRPSQGGLDLSDAYPRDVGSYDRLAIKWGYTPDADAAAREAMVREALGRGVVFPHESDARWAEYDVGVDPAAWLRTTLAVRGVMLERFGAGQLRPGEPLYDLQRRFSLAYLYHRFAIQAAQQYVGGQFVANAVAGDGQTPSAWVPDAAQRDALNGLMRVLEPASLDIPDRVLEVLVPAPFGTPPTRERFASEGGDLFSLLSAARALAGLIIHPLLDPERAARLTLPRARGALTFDEVVGRVLAATWLASPDAGSRAAALRRVTQRVALDALVELAIKPGAAPEVRAASVAQLVRLRDTLRSRRSADPVAAAHVKLAIRDLDEFLDHPEAPKARPGPPAAPPGRPIGE